MLLCFAEMPFSEDGGGVAGFAEHIGDRGELEWELDDIVDGTQRPGFPVEAVDAADGVDACAGTVESGHECGAGGLTVGATGVTGRDSQAFACEPIDVGSLVKSGSLTAEVCPAKIISEDEDQVGLGRGGASRGLGECNRRNQTDKTNGQQTGEQVE